MLERSPAGGPPCRACSPWPCSPFYKLHPRRNPPGIDFFEGDRKLAAQPISRGTYRLAGNRLTLCRAKGSERPKAFASKAGSDTYLVELGRE